MGEAEKVIRDFAEELRSIRAGRATPALVENILVEVYGTKMAIKTLAAISTPDTRTVLIEPWDVSIIPALQGAIERSGLGAQPVVDQNRIRLSVPPLTEERRRELARVISQKAEEARVRLRKIREEERELIIEEERAKMISEDAKFRRFKDLDKKTDEWMGRVEELRKAKEKEILT